MADCVGKENGNLGESRKKKVTSKNINTIFLVTFLPFDLQSIEDSFS